MHAERGLQSSQGNEWKPRKIRGRCRNSIQVGTFITSNMLRDSGIPLWEPYAPSKTPCCPLVLFQNRFSSQKSIFKLLALEGGGSKPQLPTCRKRTPNSVEWSSSWSWTPILESALASGGSLLPVAKSILQVCFTRLLSGRREEEEENNKYIK